MVNLTDGFTMLRVKYDNLNISGGVADGTELVLTLVAATSCGAGSCPTIYKTDRHTLVVQGYTVAANSVNMDLPAGEQLVEIPIELLAAAMQAAE